MAKNKKIWIVSGDFGYKMWDTARDVYPERFINTGASEQAMMGIAVGLALSGKIPIVYTATSFLLFRAFETIRNYINHENINVKLIGAGRNRDYDVDGFSHWAEEDKAVMKIFSNISCFWPEKKEEIPTLIDKMILSPKPWYINLRKSV
jgi:transketolase